MNCHYIFFIHVPSFRYHVFCCIYIGCSEGIFLGCSSQLSQNESMCTHVVFRTIEQGILIYIRLTPETGWTFCWERQIQDTMHFRTYQWFSISKYWIRPYCRCPPLYSESDHPPHTLTSSIRPQGPRVSVTPGLNTKQSQPKGPTKGHIKA